MYNLYVCIDQKSLHNKKRLFLCKIEWWHVLYFTQNQSLVLILTTEAAQAYLCLWGHSNFLENRGSLLWIQALLF